jgi:hypothetical protein
MRPAIGIRPAIVIMSVVLIALAAGIAPLRAQDHAQDYPSRSITVIVPFPAGGASDVVARIVTNQMSQILGQPIIVENVGGAGGTIGSARAAVAAPTATPCSRRPWARMWQPRCSCPMSSTIHSPTSCRSASPRIRRPS